MHARLAPCALLKSVIVMWMRHCSAHYGSAAWAAGSSVAVMSDTRHACSTVCEALRRLCMALQGWHAGRTAGHGCTLYPSCSNRGLTEALTLPSKVSQGVAYWRAELDICRRLSAHASIPAGHPDEPCISIEEIHAASQSKSFDYRVLQQACFTESLPAFLKDAHCMSCQSCAYVCGV